MTKGRSSRMFMAIRPFDVPFIIRQMSDRSTCHSLSFTLFIFQPLRNKLYNLYTYLSLAPILASVQSLCGRKPGSPGNSPIRPWCQHDHLTYRHPYHITTYIVFKIIRLILILHSITCKTTQFIISEN